MSRITCREALEILSRRNDLTHEQAHAIFTELMDGKLSEAQIAGFLMALAVKGERVAEIAGAAQAMREHAVRIDTDGLDVLDIVGTGGTGLKTFNISTTTCFVAAGAGAKVAKHGNVTNSRPSGAANVLSALGVNIDAPPTVVSRCIAEAGVGFCFARLLHPAMKFAAPVRKQLAVRTIFNVLGPLTNPAGARRLLMGTFSDEWTEPLSEVLGRLGATRAWVVHAADGLDEISITSPTRVSDYRDGVANSRTIRPEDFGLKRARLEDIAADSPETSARTLRTVLDGMKGPARDIVLLNAAAALVVADLAGDMEEGLKLAQRSIDSGAARQALKDLIRISNA
jgi:anthranilate phosphoribosyltransferase